MRNETGESKRRGSQTHMMTSLEAQLLSAGQPRDPEVSMTNSWLSVRTCLPWTPRVKYVGGSC